MKRWLLPLLAALGLTAQAPPPSGTPPIKLWRMACGSIQVDDLDVFSDTRAYVGQSKRLVGSCYLIRHGDSYMVWDTGVPADTKMPAGEPAMPSLVSQLARIRVRPEQIERVGVSHYHYDHTGQAASFPGATLLMGKRDLDVLRATPATPGANPAPLKPWIEGGAKVEAVTGDMDVFGDGTVMILNLPGHTPGHHGLLVKLPRTGNVLLTGDLAHFTENYTSNGVPSFNTDRSETLASFDRFKKLAANLKATVIIQHEAADVAKLPAFPAAAE